MKIISLVTEGLEQAARSGCLEWLFTQDADVICLQDTRCSEYSLKGDVFFPAIYHAYFLDHYENPNLNGVCIYCKELPKAIVWGLGNDSFDPQGLYIQADYAEISIGSILVPSSIEGGGAIRAKMSFLSAFSDHLEKIRNKRREFIFCGGWELMASYSDAEESGNAMSLPGLSSDEREWLLDLYGSGYTDACRINNNMGSGAYTWWPDGDDAGGLRTDTQIVSASLSPTVVSSSVFVEDSFSSHAPVIVNYDIAF